MNIDKYEIATRFRRLREKHGKSQRELAKILEISYGSIAKYESAKVIPNIAVIIKMVDYFQVDLNYFYVESEELNFYEESYLEYRNLHQKLIELENTILDKTNIYLKEIINIKTAYAKIKKAKDNF